MLLHFLSNAFALANAADHPGIRAILLKVLFKLVAFHLSVTVALQRTCDSVRKTVAEVC